MSDSRAKYLSIIKTLDMVKLIKENKNLIKPSEKNMLSEKSISSLARVIVRRKLKETFPSFSIRKNQENYALRCEDDHIYKLLFLADGVLKNNSVSSKFSNDFHRKVYETTAPLVGFLDSLSTTGGVSYSFKDGRRFFIYVPFTSNLGRYRIEDYGNFLDRSLSGKITRVTHIKEEAIKVNIDESLEKLITLFEDHSVYAVYRYCTDIDENFLNFYLENRYVPGAYQKRSLQDVVKSYNSKRLEQERLAKQDGVKVEPVRIDTAPAEFTEEAVIETTLRSNNNMPRGFRLVPSSTISNTTAAVEDTPVSEEALFTEPINEVGHEISNDHDGIQQIFEEALARIRAVREGNSEEALTMQENISIEEVIAENDPNAGDFITEESYMLFLQSLDKTEEIPNGLKVTNIDIFDDLDSQEKDGLYFSYENNKIIYKLILKDETLLATENLKEAEEKFIEIFNTDAKEIKFHIEREEVTL